MHTALRVEDGKYIAGLGGSAKASNVFLSDGVTSVEDAIDSDDYTIEANTALCSLTYSELVKIKDKLIINVVLVASTNSSSNQAIFSIKKGTAAISCPAGFVIGYRLTNDGNHAYCPLTVTGVVSAGPSYPLVATKIYNFSFIVKLT